MQNFKILHFPQLHLRSNVTHDSAMMVTVPFMQKQNIFSYLMPHCEIRKVGLDICTDK